MAEPTTEQPITFAELATRERLFVRSVFAARGATFPFGAGYASTSFARGRTSPSGIWSTPENDQDW